MSLQYGDLIELQQYTERGVAYQIDVMEEILDVVPVRFNGVEEKYQVCAPHEKEYTLIVSMNENDEKVYVFVSKNCENINLLADVI